MHPEIHRFFNAFLMPFWLPKASNLASKMHPKSIQNLFKFSSHFLLLFGFIFKCLFDHFGTHFAWFFRSWSKKPDPMKVSPLPIKSRAQASAGAAKKRAKINQKINRILYQISFDFGFILGGFWAPFWLHFRIQISLKNAFQNSSIF